MKKPLIASDTPTWLIQILGNVDFSKITDKQYKEFSKIIDDNLGKYAKVRHKAPTLEPCPLPIKQDFLNKVNKYDLNSVSSIYVTLAKPFATKWIKENLPLKRG